MQRRLKSNVESLATDLAESKREQTREQERIERQSRSEERNLPVEEVAELRRHIGSIESRMQDHEMEMGLRTSIDVQMLDRLRAALAAWEGEVSRHDYGWGSHEGNRRSQLRYAMRVAREVTELGDGSFNGQGGVRGLAVLAVAQILALAEVACSLQKFDKQIVDRVGKSGGSAGEGSGLNLMHLVDGNGGLNDGFAVEADAAARGESGSMYRSPHPPQQHRSLTGYYAASDVLEDFKVCPSSYLYVYPTHFDLNLLLDLFVTHHSEAV